MRPFEIIILLLNLLFFLALLLPFRRQPRWLVLVPILNTALVFIHLIVEGYRWQMVPVYGLTIFAFAIALRQLRSPKSLSPKMRRRRLAGTAGLILLFVAFFLPFLLPVPVLPEPSGPYAVGTTTMVLVDNSRDEIFSEDPSDKRELVLQIWYPAEKEDGAEKAPYIDNIDIAGPAIAERFDLPAFLLKHLNLVRTHAFVDPPIAVSQDKYPLLLFSHGWNGLRMQNTFQMEELASQGYIVASPSHTHDSILTVFPDGRVIFNGGEAVLGNKENGEEPGRKTVEVRVRDLTFILDHLQTLNDQVGSPFFERFNLELIGIIGHSTGGGTAVEACQQDDRCQAVLVLDSWLEPLSAETLNGRLSWPSMFINTAEWLSDENRAAGQTLFQNALSDSYAITLEGAEHMNFTDLPLLSPLTRLVGLAGPINGERGLEIINVYSLAFLDTYLLGKQDPLLSESTSRYSEADLQTHYKDTN